MNYTNVKHFKDRCTCKIVKINILTWLNHWHDLKIGQDETFLTEGLRSILKCHEAIWSHFMFSLCWFLSLIFYFIIFFMWHRFAKNRAAEKEKCNHTHSIFLIILKFLTVINLEFASIVFRNYFTFILMQMRLYNLQILAINKDSIYVRHVTELHGAKEVPGPFRSVLSVWSE